MARKRLIRTMSGQLIAEVSAAGTIRAPDGRRLGELTDDGQVYRSRGDAGGLLAVLSESRRIGEPGGNPILRLDENGVLRSPDGRALAMIESVPHAVTRVGPAQEPPRGK